MTRCPYCDGPLNSRFYDEEAQMSYPCDDGEGFCIRCDEIVSTDPFDAPPIGQMTEVVAPPFRAMPDGPGSRPSGQTNLRCSGASRFDPYRKGKAA